MLSFIVLILVLDWASKIQVGYKEVPVTRDMPEYWGYDSNSLDDVMEFYEQKRSGYFNL